jgi:hypothetical protein
MLGRSVAFWRFDVGGDAGARPVELVRIDEAGREQRVLEQTMGTEHGRESTPPPTDKQFGCARRAESVCIFGEYKSGAFALHRLDPKTGNLEHPLYQRAASKAATFDVSPDGRTVAMVGLEVGGLLLISLANGDAREIKLGDGLWQSVHWTPDGAGLMLTGMGNRGHNFVIVHADLRGNTKLLHSSNSRWFTQAIPSPDGKRLAFGEMTHERNVELTEGL